MPAQATLRIHRTTAVETVAGQIHRPRRRRRSAPHTFDNRMTAEAWVVALRRKIDRDQWLATDDNPRETVTFGAYATLAGQPAGGG